MDEANTNSIASLLNATYGSSGGGGWDWSNIIGGVIFGIIGFVAFNYGRKMKSSKPLMVGIALMVFPYFVSNTLLLYIIGAGLCAALYFWRD